MALKALVVADPGSPMGVVGTLGVDSEIETISQSGFGRLVESVRLHNPDIVVMVPAAEKQAIAAIQELMAMRPVPILVIGREPWSHSSLVSAGAVDTMTSPAEDAAGETELRARVRLVSRIKTIRHIRGRSSNGPLPTHLLVVAIAASTGGPQAVIAVLRGLTGLQAAVVVVQHLNPGFTSHFLEWMVRESPLPVTMAVDGAVLEAGHVYLAPGDVHVKLSDDRKFELCELPATLHRPSADVLFGSIARHAGHDAVGVLLTGMGDDGASGLLEMRRAGATTIAQDKESSAIYGMPGAAFEAGAAEHVLPLERIASAILRAVSVSP